MIVGTSSEFGRSDISKDMMIRFVLIALGNGWIMTTSDTAQMSPFLEAPGTFVIIV